MIVLFTESIIFKLLDRPDVGGILLAGDNYRLMVAKLDEQYTVWDVDEKNRVLTESRAGDMEAIANRIRELKMYTIYAPVPTVSAAADYERAWV